MNEQHYEELTADISERIWILLGQSVHTILERASENREDTLTEERMYAEVSGWRISGQTDSISLEDNTLKDYKVTSAWTVMNALKDEKPEWVQQLNCYGWLAKQAGKTIKPVKYYCNLTGLVKNSSTKEVGVITSRTSYSHQYSHVD